MSSLKKVLCVKPKGNQSRCFTAGNIYDVDFKNGFERVKDDNGFYTCIFSDGSPCIYGEWQPLEEYMCMTGIYPGLKIGDFFFGYKSDGSIIYPQGDGHEREFRNLSSFKKVSEMTVGSDPKKRFEVRHVVYDAKENKVANDAMGECYITFAEAHELCDEMNAPKVMKPAYTKEVEYFGVKIMVPDDAKSIATHRDGNVFVSDELLCESVCGWGTSGYLKQIFNVDLNGIDWKDTLVEIK